MTIERFVHRPVDGAIVRVEGAAAVVNVITSPQKLDPASLNLQVKNGTPDDSDIVGAAASGDIVVDTAANKLWIRVGATWKYASLT